MAWTQSDVDALKSAIATGARRVRFGSGVDAQEVEYRSLSEMRTALDLMSAEVAGPARRVTTSFVRHDRS